MGRRSRSASRSVSRSPSAGRTSSRRRREGGGGHARSRDRSRSRQRSRRSPSRSRSPRRSRRDDERSKPKEKEDKPREEDKGPRTTEENGEISMSIEETNKLRISLGLKPLSVGPKKEKNLVNLQKTSEQLAEEKERDEIKKALEQSRRKRELTQKLAGKSIGQELKESAASSALDWVKQSRQSAAQQAAAAKKAQKKQKEAEGTSYDASALAGMTVSHDVDAFDEGVDVVLTLKDSRVLTEDGGDVNDEADELMNVELSERDRLETRQKQAQRANMPVYTGYDDDEFIQMGVTKKKKKLLAHYDADEEQKADEEAKKFTLDAAGRSQISAKAKAKAAQDEALDGVEVVSLSMNKSKAMDDYYTQEEMEATFAKKSKKMRKKKKLRKKLEEEEENEGDPSALLAQLEAEAQQNSKGSNDRGKRRRPVHNDDDGRDHVLASAEEEGLRRFQEARKKASAVASSALEASTGIKKKKRRAAAWEDGEDALDLELSANVARSRQLAQLKQQQEEGGATLQSREAKLAALVSQAIGDEPDKVDGDVSMVAAGNVFVETESSNTVVFNDATDFETRLRSAMEQRTAQFQATASASTTTTTSTEVSSKEVKEEDDGEAMEIDSDKEEAKQENDEDDESKTGESWGDEQPLVAGGMGATLALLRRTGELRETRVERQAGRANDSRDRNVDDEFRVKDGVKLDYRDEFGRLLTKKEAFRMLSYKFHGHKPGKKKQEKRLKQLKEELEAQKALSGEGSTKMMKVLEKKQQHAQQAFVVLSNGS